MKPTYVVSFHQPLHGVGRDDERRPFQRRLAHGLGLPIKAFNCSGVCHGTMTSWFNAHHAGTAITVEFGSGARPEVPPRPGRPGHAERPAGVATVTPPEGGPTSGPDPRAADLGCARVDLERGLRTGDPEVVYGAGKTPEQVVGDPGPAARGAPDTGPSWPPG